MSPVRPSGLHAVLGRMFQAHPWHGIPAGVDAPARVNVFVEIVPTESVKYELDKASGHLKVDRPQRYSSTSPTLYGLIPRTYCGERVAHLCYQRTGIEGLRGDGDPLDVCVLTEKDIAHASFLLQARPIGGLRMIDADEADDKIIAVLEGDVAFGDLRDIDQVPPALVDRLRHYFLSYKQFPGEAPRRVEIAEVYGASRAREVIRAAMDDYLEAFGPPERAIEQLRALLVRPSGRRAPARRRAKRR